MGTFDHEACSDVELVSHGMRMMLPLWRSMLTEALMYQSQDTQSDKVAPRSSLSQEASLDGILSLHKDKDQVEVDQRIVPASVTKTGMHNSDAAVNVARGQGNTSPDVWLKEDNSANCTTTPLMQAIASYKSPHQAGGRNHLVHRDLQCSHNDGLSLEWNITTTVQIQEDLSRPIYQAHLDTVEDTGQPEPHHTLRPMSPLTHRGVTPIDVNARLSDNYRPSHNQHDSPPRSTDEDLFAKLDKALRRHFGYIPRIPTKEELRFQLDEAIRRILRNDDACRADTDYTASTPPPTPDCRGLEHKPRLAIKEGLRLQIHHVRKLHDHGACHVDPSCTLCTVSHIHHQVVFHRGYQVKRGVRFRVYRRGGKSTKSLLPSAASPTTAVDEAHILTTIGRDGCLGVKT